MLRAFELVSPDGNEVVGVSVWDSAESRDAYRRSDVESSGAGRWRRTSSRRSPASTWGASSRSRAIELCSIELGEVAGHASRGARELGRGSGVSGDARLELPGGALCELGHLVGPPGDLLRDADRLGAGPLVLVGQVRGVGGRVLVAELDELGRELARAAMPASSAAKRADSSASAAARAPVSAVAAPDAGADVFSPILSRSSATGSWFSMVAVEVEASGSSGVFPRMRSAAFSATIITGA